MDSEKEYLRFKRYRMKHADEIRAKHDEWIEAHREEWNSYMREYRLRRKAGLKGGKKSGETEAKRDETGIYAGGAGRAQAD